MPIHLPILVPVYSCPTKRGGLDNGILTLDSIDNLAEHQRYGGKELLQCRFYIFPSVGFLSAENLSFGLFGLPTRVGSEIGGPIQKWKIRPNLRQEMGGGEGMLAWESSYLEWTEQESREAKILLSLIIRPSVAERTDSFNMITRLSWISNTRTVLIFFQN